MDVETSPVNGFHLLNSLELLICSIIHTYVAGIRMATTMNQRLIQNPARFTVNNNTDRWVR